MYIQKNIAKKGYKQVKIRWVQQQKIFILWVKRI